MKMKILIIALTFVLMLPATAIAQSPATGTNNGYDYVDLGLSVMWATCNIGANSPEECGDYFAWGEVVTKAEYTDENSATYGTDNYIFHDAAVENWGGSWRMPTSDEYRELVGKCTWQWTSVNGQKGYKVTSKKNGNSIFLPAAGYHFRSKSILFGKKGWYSSSTPDESGDNNNAYELNLNKEIPFLECNLRCSGISVRAVFSTARTFFAKSPSPTPSVINGHEYVDLGLSVKWATCNIGANKPEDSGDYFAWGETKAKSEYFHENSTTCGNENYILLDAAVEIWGSTWRLPTQAECHELCDNCIWQWTKIGGQNGYKVISMKNGNSIFLPAAGYFKGSSQINVGEWCYFWSSSPYENDSKGAYSLIFSRFGFPFYIDKNARCNGLPIRPVSE